MEEEKIQSLHDSLSKLRKSAGLGISSHLNFGGPNASGLSKRDRNGNLVRKDGLPTDALYSNFVREGLYDPTKKNQNDAAKYGDGRFIKRNFDDCSPEAGQTADVSNDDSSTARRTKKAEKKKKLKAAKLEAKKQKKLDEKRKAKLAAKRSSKKATTGKESNSIACKAEPIAGEKISSKSKKSKRRQNQEDDPKNGTNLTKQIEENEAEVIKVSPLTDNKQDKKVSKKSKKKV